MSMTGLRHTPTEDEILDLMASNTPNHAYTVPPWLLAEFQNATESLVAELQKPIAYTILMRTVFASHYAAFALGVAAERERWDVDPRPAHPAEEELS